jgi:hypothetical protein
MGRFQDSASLIAQDNAGTSASDAFTFGKKKKGQMKKGPQTPFNAKATKGKAAFKGGFKGGRGR